MSKQEGHVQDSADWEWSLPSPISQSDNKFIAQIVTGEKKANFLSNIMFLVPPKQEYQSDTSSTYNRIENRRNT